MQHKHPVRRRVASLVLVVLGVALGGATGLTPALTPAPAAAAPKERLFVPGVSLGGATLGMTKRELTTLWGTKHGVCRSCDRTTWYFNDRAFVPQGVGATFERGVVVALFTVWKPLRWRTPEGLVLGDNAARVTITYGALPRRVCVGYEALVFPGRRGQSAFLLDDGVLWGFALTRPAASPCL